MRILTNRTRHVAPKGYTAVDKQLAVKLFDAGADVTIAGNNVNSFHIFGGWALGYTFNKARIQDEVTFNTFDSILNNWLFYLDRELGTYASFYVPTKQVQQLGK